MAGRTRRGAATYTLRDLAAEYEASPAFEAHSPNTRRAYQTQITKAVDLLGKFPANDVLASDIHHLLDNEGWGAASKNLFVAVIANLYQWARRRGKASIEPTKDIAKFKTGQHEPWPLDVLESALSCDVPRVRLATHLLYFTGQRIGDVCAMRWGDVRGGFIHVVQQKTGKRLSIPIHSELQAELDRAPKLGLFIITRHTGGKISDERLRRDLQVFTEGQGAKTVPHGLRKNAVNSLLEAGCAVAEVSAITGQTFAMVEHYAARVDTRKLGGAAMLKFERSRK